MKKEKTDSSRINSRFTAPLTKVIDDSTAQRLINFKSLTTKIKSRPPPNSKRDHTHHRRNFVLSTTHQKADSRHFYHLSPPSQIHPLALSYSSKSREVQPGYSGWTPRRARSHPTTVCVLPTPSNIPTNKSLRPLPPLSSLDSFNVSIGLCLQKEGR